MSETGGVRYKSATGPIILIAIGIILLILNFRPDFNPWPFLERYWPVLLILLGLGKMWDAYVYSKHPGLAIGWGLMGGLVALLVVASFAMTVGHWGRNRGNNADVHQSQSVDLQGAQSVAANIQMPAGQLEVGGGSDHLLDAEFNYTTQMEKPGVAYTVTNGHGQLDVTQRQEGPNFGRGHDDWNLHFGDAIPLDLSLNMGAGQSDMKLGDLNITNLTVNIGAGQMNLDLTGDRKNNLQAQIHGGVGSAKIRLPKNVGVRVHASGGIGSIDADDLKRDGDDYINDAIGKTPATITMNIEGGIGEIKLEEEP